jgi:hypothetical protein
MTAVAISYGAKAEQAVCRIRRLPGIATGLKLGVGYWRAAERDEKNGFPFTAAMEWRRAAELFGPIALASGYCWREWERIMHLPRRLACPVVESAEVRLQYLLTFDSQKISKAAVNELPVALAA